MMRRSGQSPAFIRPAILEAVLLATLGAAAILAVIGGLATRCTALVEFGLLSAIGAASAAVLLARYTIEICGFLADYRWFEFWGARLSIVCYLSLGAYALANGILDLAVPRRDADWISYPGLFATLIAIVMVTLVLLTKYRALESLPSRSLFESVAEDTFYLQAGAAVLVALLGHLFMPAWWLDTATDVVVLVLIAYKLRRTFAHAALAA